MKYKVALISINGDSLAVAQYLHMEEIGMGYIASVLRKMGYHVMITGSRECDINYKKISEFKPDIIGCSVYNVTAKPFYRFCTKIKQILPGSIICAGGYAPTYHYKEMMKEVELIDFVIRGEGEYSFLELLSCLENGGNLEDINGLVYRSGSDIKVNRDREFIRNLDELPFPSRDLALDNNWKVTTISTSRGCLANCSFCVAKNFWKKWRGRSVENVVEELAYLNKLGFQYISFLDNSIEDSDDSWDRDNFARLKGIAKGMIEKRIGISYIADMRADFYKKADDELVNLLIESGLRVLFIGIESGNEYDLRIYGKMQNLEDNEKTLEFFSKFPLKIRMGFINFNAYSTLDNLLKNINFLEKYGYAKDYHKISSRYILEKGGRLYKKMEQDGLIKITDFTNVHHYDFVDKNVQSLSDFLKNYVDDINGKTHNALLIIGFYCETYVEMMLDLRLKIKRDKEIYDLILKHESNIYKILATINSNNSNSFRELLNLARSWDEKRAGEIMEKYLSAEQLVEYVTSLNNEVFRFKKEVSLLKPEYNTIINEFTRGMHKMV